MEDDAETDRLIAILAHGPLDVGDRTMMVRPVAASPRLALQLAVVAGVAGLAIAAAFVVITIVRGGSPEREAAAVPPALATPSAPAEVPAVVPVPDLPADDEPLDAVAVGSAVTRTALVKLREDARTASQSKPKRHRRIKATPRPAAHAASPWDRHSLFPSK